MASMSAENRKIIDLKRYSCVLREPQLCHKTCLREYVLWPPLDTGVVPALCLRVLNVCSTVVEPFNYKPLNAVVGSCKVLGQLSSCFQSHFIFRGKDIKYPFIKKYIPRDHDHIKEASMLVLLSGPGVHNNNPRCCYSNFLSYSQWTLLS